MRPLYYFLLADALLLVIAIKLVFKSYALFIQTLFSRFEFWSHFMELPPAKQALPGNANYKLNIIYAIALVLGILTVILVKQL